MNISGLVIMTVPKKTKQVVEKLKDIEGLEIHRVLEDGKIVAVLERESTGEEVNTVRNMYDIDGVITATMAYHHFEEEVDEMINEMEKAH